MYYFKNLDGKTFGKLTVLSKSKIRNKSRSVLWTCRCACGTIKEVVSSALINGNTKSCGCLKFETKNTKRPYEAIYHILRLSAKSNSRDMSISYEDFVEFTKTSSCFYCNGVVTWSPYLQKKKGIKRNCRYNIDRKDNLLGYTKENVIICCSRCNYGKGDRFTYKEWYKMTEPFRTGELSNEVNM